MKCLLIDNATHVIDGWLESAMIADAPVIEPPEGKRLLVLTEADILLINGIRPFMTDNSPHYRVCAEGEQAVVTLSNGQGIRRQIETDMSILQSAQIEIARIASAIPYGVQQVTLETNGEAVIRHSINSLWYCVFIQSNAPNLIIDKSQNSFTILGGETGTVVVYRVEPLLPPAGSENLIFAAP